MAAAVSASIISPVSSISMACFAGTARLSATIGVEQKRPMFTPGVAKRAERAGDGEVAGGDELAPGGGGHAVDLGDHRMAMVDDREHQLGAPLEQLLAEAGVGIVTDLVQIVTGREHRSVAGEHDDVRVADRH